MVKRVSEIPMLLVVPFELKYPCWKLAQFNSHVCVFLFPQRLANSKAHTSRFISANLPCNKFKNRLVNIMPYETTRVCLQPIRGLEGSDYINSSFIDGYRYADGGLSNRKSTWILLHLIRWDWLSLSCRQQKAYIATQGPLAETTEDFWRMLWENNSTIVVMLTKLREMGRVSVASLQDQRILASGWCHLIVLWRVFAGKVSPVLAGGALG